MARSDEAAAFFHAVYCAVQEIPHGRVTSYGHIAKLVGTREYLPPIPTNSPKYCAHTTVLTIEQTAQRPRQVGVCLKHLSRDAGSRFNHGNVPWQRVVNSKGVISPRSHPSGTQNQAAALRAEGVTVIRGAMGELMVDFGEVGWFPGELPSEAGDYAEVDEEEEQ